MKILSAPQIKDWDKYTIQNEPISSIDLMERASQAFSEWYASRFSKQQSIIVFCGPGNNGGDGLAIARLLILGGYKVEIFSIHSDKRSDDYLLNEQRLLELCPIHSIKTSEDIPTVTGLVVIDALFGSGLSRPVSGVYKEVINQINNSKTTVVSVDIASGLYCDSANEDAIVVQPTYTVSFQSPKLSFLLPQNAKYVGKMEVVNIGLSDKFLNTIDYSYSYIESKLIRSLLRKREKFSHKGTYGTALIVGGSYGMIGAVVLACKACLRTGVGLCVSYIPRCGYEILQSTVPENMVITDVEVGHISSVPELTKYKAIGVGTGLGKNTTTKEALEMLLRNASCPLVIDADGLNIISENKELISLIRQGSVLTPHPKEFERLVGKANDDYHRLDKLSNFSSQIKSVVILKGAHTAIAMPDGKIYFNSTGNPGMATGGSGDVLTGILTSLIAQGYSIEHAAILGVYLHGYAGDVASAKHSQEGMIASDIIEGIADFYKGFV